MNILFKLSGLFYKLHQYFFNKARINELSTLPLSEVNKNKWYKDNKEKFLRYEYPLNPDSIVMDVGGYEGDFASEIFARYQSRIFVFEPVNRYVNFLNNRFKSNNYIKIIPSGLGSKNEMLKINVMEEASSYNRAETIHKKGEEEVISSIDVVNFFNENEIKNIGLIKINIEGGEYDLLDKMIESGYAGICTNIQVQFHDFYPDFQKRYNHIKNELSKTHRLTYNYPFVWENWQLK